MSDEREAELRAMIVHHAKSIIGRCGSVHGGFSNRLTAQLIDRSADRIKELAQELSIHPDRGYTS